MIHYGDFAAGIDCDGMSGFDLDGQQSTGFRANLVCGNGTDGVDNPGIVAQAVNFFPGAVNPEFAVVLDEGGAS